MAKGRWSAFKRTLPRLQPPPDWQAKVDAAKISFDGQTHIQLARRLRQVKLEKEELESQIKAINIIEEALSQKLLVWMEENDTTRITLPSGTLYERNEPYTRIADREKVVGWMRATGHEELLSVHWQTLNALVKERMEAGEPNPDGCEVFIKTSVILKKE